MQQIREMNREIERLVNFQRMLLKGAAWLLTTLTSVLTAILIAYVAARF